MASAGDRDQLDGAAGRAACGGGGHHAGGLHDRDGAVVDVAPGGVERRDCRPVDARDAVTRAAVVGDVVVGGAVDSDDRERRRGGNCPVRSRRTPWEGDGPAARRNGYYRVAGTAGRTGMTSQADHNLAVLAEGAFHRLGDYESLVFEGQTYRSGDLFDRACRVSGGLAKLGVSPGERVVVLMANCPEVGIAYSAIWRAGAVVTPVVFLISPPELQHILTDSGAVAVVTTPELLATVTAAVKGAGEAGGAPDLRHVIVVGGAPGALPGHVRGVDFAELESAPAGGITGVSDDDLAALMYTGGTTGRAKGVMLSHRNLYYCSRSSHEASQAEGITRALTPLPLSHAYGMIVTLVGYHATEQALGVLQRWFDPAEFLALAQQHRIQRTALVPAMIQMLLAQPLEDTDLSSLRYVNSGAAPLAAETREQWERRVPGSEILEGYGCTESGSVISVNPPGGGRPGSAGLPIPGYQVEIHGDNDGDWPDGGEGWYGS